MIYKITTILNNGCVRTSVLEHPPCVQDISAMIHAVGNKVQSFKVEPYTPDILSISDTTHQAKKDACNNGCNLFKDGTCQGYNGNDCNRFKNIYNIVSNV